MPTRPINRSSLIRLLLFLLSVAATTGHAAGAPRSGAMPSSARSSDDHDRLTPLMQAVIGKQESDVANLLKDLPPRDLNRKGPAGRTALMLASEKGLTRIVQLLLEAHAGPDLQDNQGRTALMLASINLHAGVVIHLLDAKASFSLKDRDGMTSLLHAVSQDPEDPSYLKTALPLVAGVTGTIGGGEVLNSKNKRGETALLIAARRGTSSLVDELLKKGALSDMPDRHGRTALMEAALGGKDAVVKSLLSEDGLRRPADRNLKDHEGMTAFLLAVKHGHDLAWAIAFRDGPGGGKPSPAIDPNEANDAGQTALILASQQGHARMVNRMIELHRRTDGGIGFDLDAVDRQGWTALMRAISKGHTAIAKSLLDANAGVRPADPDGTNALLLAASRGHLDIASALLKAGADLRHRNRDGLDALTLATDMGHKDLVRLFLDRGANPAGQDGNESTPLMHAAYNGHTEIARLLIQRGARVNTGNRYGNTALMQAAISGHAETARLLLQNGAAPDAKNDLGKTAWNLAQDRGFKDFRNQCLKP